MTWIKRNFFMQKEIFAGLNRLLLKRTMTLFLISVTLAVALLNITSVWDNFLLLKRFLVAPRTIGAIAPTSATVARYMAQKTKVIWEKDPTQYVLEAGPGTGCITQALLMAGIPPEKIVCVELDLGMYQRMVKRFPQLHIIHGDVANLMEIFPKDQPIGAIVSALPLTNFSDELRLTIEKSFFAALSDGGGLVEITYRNKSPLKHNLFVGEKVKRIYCNLPPANIWVYRKPIVLT